MSRPTDLVQKFIHDHLAYRYVVVQDSGEAHELEKLVRSCALSGKKPLLNPI